MSKMTTHTSTEVRFFHEIPGAPEDECIDITDHSKTLYDSKEQQSAYESYAAKLYIKAIFRDNFAQMMVSEEVQKKTEAEKNTLKSQWFRAQERYMAQMLEDLSVDEENRSMLDAERRMTDPKYEKMTTFLGV